MKYRDFQYLWAYVIPIIVIIALFFKGWFSYGGLFVAFFVIPLLELFMPGTKANFSEEEEAEALKRPIFNFLLYLNVPFIWVILIWYLIILLDPTLSNFEYVGLTLTVGIFLGAMGINVAHELGHRNNLFEQVLAKMLLLPNLYMHFTLEHNNGHHVHIATPRDPASSRMNEWIYVFYFRSVLMSYVSAWKLQLKQLKKTQKNFFSWSNQMLWEQLLQVVYLAVVFFVFGPLGLYSAILVAIAGFLMLESVNYIEHYGLQRRLLPSGRYERVQPWHSWNSNHRIGRIMLYELTRHSDHHYKASRKYQILRHFDDAPQLPFGYPMSMLIALFPPLWFALMNKRVRAIEQKTAEIPLN